MFLCLLVSMEQIKKFQVTLRNRTLDLQILHSDDPKVLGSNPHGDSDFFHCLTLIAGQRNIFLFSIIKLKM